jgi:hypothetical protein
MYSVSQQAFIPALRCLPRCLSVLVPELTAWDNYIRIMGSRYSQAGNLLYGLKLRDFNVVSYVIVGVLQPSYFIIFGRWFGYIFMPYRRRFSFLIPATCSLAAGLIGERRV